MHALLLKHYPYKPKIDDLGEIDPNSIHSKKQELAPTILTAAATAALLLKIAPRSWALLGTGVAGAVSYLFWSKIGREIPNTLADQICTDAFLTPIEITPNVAKRVLANDSLHKDIFNAISSLTSNKASYLKNYLNGIWEFIPLTERLPRYLATIIQLSEDNRLFFKITIPVCMSVFLSTDPVPEAIAKQVAGYKDLNDEIFKKISSEPDPKKKDALLEHYFVSIWMYINSTDRLDRYLPTVKAMSDPVMKSFKPDEYDQMFMWVHRHELDDEKGKLLKHNFNIDVVHNKKNTISTLAESAILLIQRNPKMLPNTLQEKWTSIIDRISLILRLNPNIQLNLPSSLPAISTIPELQNYLKKIPTNHKHYQAASLLKDYK